MILSNGMLGGAPTDVRIENGRIVELGSDLGGGIDLEGRHLVPGLWDHHVHFTQWALTSQRVDLSTAASARVAAELVGSAIESGAGSAGLLIGAGFRDANWPDAPNLADLDRVAGSLPVVLVSGDLHCVWLNSAALVVYGFAGHPTGLLTEDDAFAVEGQLGTFPHEVIDAWARQAADAAAARGVVGVCDLEMGWNLETWQRRIAQGHDALRVQFMVYTQHLERAIAEGLRTGDVIGDLLSVGYYKVLSDGSLNTRTAFMAEDYPGHQGHRGQFTVPFDELVGLMRRASAAGILPDVHAIGDGANTLVLDAFEAVGGGGRVEHAQLVAAADFPRFARLGVEVGVQPEHAMDDREVADRHWAGLTGGAYAFRSLLDSGARLLFGSDAPVSPLDPWLAISAAVSRSRGGEAPWHPEQRITVAEALGASTRTTIAVGQPADIAITEIDPLAATGEQLRTMPVSATLLAGRFTHNAL
ncbi:amidohydrolase family protein [soil metagenome]